MRPTLGVGGQPATASPLTARVGATQRPAMPAMPLQTGTGPGTTTPGVPMGATPLPAPQAPVVSGPVGAASMAGGTVTPTSISNPVMRR